MKAKTLVKIILLISMSTILTLQAESINDEEKTLSSIDTGYTNYVRMSTEELQEAIEVLSLNGEYPLEMGMELFKRWSQES